MGIDSHRWTPAVAAGDPFGTGYPDLFSPTTMALSQMFANREGKRFVDERRTGMDAQERDERGLRRRLQRWPAGHL